MQPQRVSRHRHQHRPHAEVEPPGFAQHGHAGVHHGPAGAALHQGVQVGRVARFVAQAVVAPVQVAPLQFGLVFQLLNEMAMPHQPARECSQPLLLAAGLGRQVRHAQLGGLHHLAQAQAAQRQVRRKARAGTGCPQGRRNATPVLGAAGVQKLVQHSQTLGAPTALAQGRVGVQQAQLGRARHGGLAPRQRHRAERGRCQRARRAGVRGPLVLPALAAGQAAHHAKLGRLLPGHTVGAAPAAHRQVASVGGGVAGFLVGVQRFKRRQRHQARQHIGHFTSDHVQAGAQRFQLAVQIQQALSQKMQVLGRGVGLGPQAGLQHIQAQHRPARGGLVQRRVVVHAQVAFEPDHAVAHGGARSAAGGALDHPAQAVRPTGDRETNHESTPEIKR